MARNEFVKKSVGTLTLGEKLKKIRSERRVSLGDISRNTKIQVKYLEYLENEEYEKLPSDVYVKGFLRGFASHFGIGESSLIKLYEREREIRKHVKKEEGKEKFIKPLKFSGWVVTPKMIMIFFAASLVFLGFFYLYREVKFFISTPRLAIAEPLDGSEIEGNSVRVRGITEKDAEVIINNQPVVIDAEGKFSEIINLQPGVNIITASSKNRFDKESTKKFSVNARYFQRAETQNEMETQDYSAAEAEKNVLEIEVDPNPVWLSVEADGELVFSGVLSPKMVKKFEAREQFSVSADKGNNTYVKINGRDKEILSPDPGLVKNIILKDS